MSDDPAPTTERRWQPLTSKQRRVFGVLLEKAKTTPEAYPMTLNAIRNGCNQKNNRAPVTTYEEDDVQQALDDLRKLGAVAEVQGSGRVAKYRHFFYEWLGVDKLESAVMGELLLRGAQSEGDLRGRASRMEAIGDLDTLRTVLRSLKAKGLVIPLTPEGRGHVVSHALYQDQELDKVRAQFAGGAPSNAIVEGDEEAPAASGSTNIRDELKALREEVSALRQEVAELKARM